MNHLACVMLACFQALNDHSSSFLPLLFSIQLPLTPPSHPSLTLPSLFSLFPHPSQTTKAAADEAIAASPSLLYTLDLADGPVNCVSWAPNGVYIALTTQSFEHRVRVYVAAEKEKEGGLVAVVGVGMVAGAMAVVQGAAEKGTWVGE